MHYYNQKQAWGNVRHTRHFDGARKHFLGYSSLYESDAYKSKAKLKIRFVKNLIRTVHLRPLMISVAYVQSLERVEETYPDDGGRKGLNSLIALHNLLRHD